MSNTDENGLTEAECIERVNPILEKIKELVGDQSRRFDDEYKGFIQRHGAVNGEGDDDGQKVAMFITYILKAVDDLTNPGTFDEDGEDSFGPWGDSLVDLLNGIKRSKSETPSEASGRLAHYPALLKDLWTILHNDVESLPPKCLQMLRETLRAQRARAEDVLNKTLRERRSTKPETYSDWAKALLQLDVIDRFFGRLSAPDPMRRGGRSGGPGTGPAGTRPKKADSDNDQGGRPDAPRTAKRKPPAHDKAKSDNDAGTVAGPGVTTPDDEGGTQKNERK